MEMNNPVAGKMENIKTIFQNARETAAKHRVLNELIKLLETADHEFLSVAFEGASMEIALNDFTGEPSMKNWISYLNLAHNHSAQIFIGLGWAIAQERRKELSFLKNLNPGMLFRMWDGCGYYDGILRQRQVIKSKVRLDYIPEEDFRSYAQGLGRSIWYNTKGDLAKAAEIISTFPTATQADLWRGIGIASSYVGGCSENTFQELLFLSGNNKIHLGIGAAMVAKSRIQANSITPDIEIACKTLCNMSAQDAMNITVNADSGANGFETWLSGMVAEIEKKSLRIRQ